MTSWIKAGHNDWCSVRAMPKSFMFKVNKKANHCYSNFQDACDFTAARLKEDWSDKPWFLALSGGLDSEIVANTLIRNHMLFTPLILKIERSNEDESWYAEHWCRTNNLTPKILTISLNEWAEMINQYSSVVQNTHQIGIAAYLYLSDYVTQHLDSYLVSGLGDINQDGEKFYTNAVDFCLDMWRPKCHPTGFFMYTPELALSYIKNFDPLLDEQLNKLSFYHICPRPKMNWINRAPELSGIVAENIHSHQLSQPNSDAHWFESQ